MIDRRLPSEATPHSLDQQWVELLAEYDEQLRSGSQAEREAQQTERLGDTPELKPLLECVDFVERIWPRRRYACDETAAQTQLGRFRIERLLGQGGFGIVYLATDPALGRPVALKVPRFHALASPQLVERFHREARTAAALDHPHIVPVYEAGEADGLHYIASAYCPGPNLAQWLRDQPGQIAPEVAARILASLADAVAYSHDRGILHRDIKPSNIMLAPPARPRSAAEPATSLSDPLPFSPRLGDFGLAKILQDPAAGHLAVDDSGGTALLGTPAYMAPEQLQGLPDAVGPAADIYSLGVVLYQLLSGHPPFQGASVVDVLDHVRTSDPAPLRRNRSDIPIDLEVICHRCLMKAPAQRYATAADLRDELCRFLNGQPIAAKKPAHRQFAKTWLRRRPATIAAVAIVCAVSIATLTWHRGLPLETRITGSSETRASSPAVVAAAGAVASSRTVTEATQLTLGLVAAPAELPGKRQWRMVTRGPRSVVQHD